MEPWLVIAASALAGFVDAIVGGGGLVLVPALFAAYPSAAPPTLLGTNKSASIWGTAVAAAQYARRVKLEPMLLVPAGAAALVASALGAEVVTRLDATLVKRALPVLLVVLLVYTLARKDLGREHRPRAHGAVPRAVAIGAAVGFYDGVFGPGAGSFLVFLFVRWLGHDFLHASAHAKVINVITNGAALATFAWQGHVWWHLALGLALANVAGSVLGTRLALARGAGFVRSAFVVVVAALIVKTAHDAYLR
jgi:uncharacterized protein